MPRHLSIDNVDKKSLRERMDSEQASALEYARARQMPEGVKNRIKLQNELNYIYEVCGEYMTRKNAYNPDGWRKKMVTALHALSDYFDAQGVK